MLNFIKSHCLIGDFVEGTLTHFVNKHVVTIEVDRISANLRSDNAFYAAAAAAAASAAASSSASGSSTQTINDNLDINVFYLGTGN